MIIIPIGRILQLVSNISANPKRSRQVLYLVIGASLYIVLAIVLSEVIGSRSRSAVSLVCGSALLVALITGVIVIAVGVQEPKASSGVAWLSLSEAAKYLHMSETEVTGLIKSGKLQARKVDGKYRMERELLDLFVGKKSL